MSPWRRVGRRTADALQYAGYLVGLTSLGVGGASVLVVGDLRPLKWALFLLGLVCIGYGAVKLRPAPAWKDDPREAFLNARTDRGFGAAVGRWPPLGWLPTSAAERATDGTRLFVTGIVAWIVSFALEAVGGVGVPTVG